VAVAAWPLRGPALLDPAGEGPSLPPLVETLAGVAFPLLVVCGILSVLSLVVRFRRSRAVERQQLKWFVYAAAVTLSGVLITEALPIPEGSVLDSLLAVAGLAVVPSVPVAAGVAILRYRLVRDRPDRQPHAGLRRPDRPAGRGVRRRSPWAAPSAEPGRVAAARGRVHPGRGRLFSPARRRVQSAVDRRFNRARYDATRTVETFSARLRDQVELDSLSADLLAVVDHTVQPTKASLWLRPW